MLSIVILCVFVCVGERLSIADASCVCACARMHILLNLSLHWRAKSHICSVPLKNSTPLTISDTSCPCLSSALRAEEPTPKNNPITLKGENACRQRCTEIHSVCCY